jgi:regulator of nonsense transcripts 2
MRSQQAAEREEQQRIKNLVLNYDLRDGEEQDGDLSLAPIHPNPNIHTLNTGLEKAAANTYSRLDKSGNNRSGQRARKLQLSDVDWYDPKTNSSHSFKPTPYTALATSGPVKFPGQDRAAGGGFLRHPITADRGEKQPRVGKPARMTAQVSGRLRRKEILREHASRQAASKSQEADS